MLRIPQVSIVDRAHEDVGQQNTNILVDLEPDRVVQALRADQVPIEAPREEAHPFVVASSAEDVAEHGAAVVRKAKDRHTRQKWEDPCWAKVGVSNPTA